MSVILDKDLYQWLLALDVLKVATKIKETSSSKVEIDSNISASFTSGQVFGKLLLSMIKTVPKLAQTTKIDLKTLEAIKPASTPASRIYNWNIISDAYKKFDLEIDKDVRNLIVNGDMDMNNDLLKQIYDHFHPNKHDLKGDTSSQRGTQQFGKSLARSESRSKDVAYRPKPQDEEGEQDAMPSERDLVSTKTVMDFLAILTSRHMSVTPKQAVPLLANNFKFLAHILAKGLKGAFEPVMEWYLELRKNIKYLVGLILLDPKENMNLVQQACKPGLLSKSEEVVVMACRCYAELASEFSDKNLISYAWDWFISESGGLQTCIIALKRHPEINEEAMAMLVNYARSNFMELLTVHLRNACTDPNEHLLVMKELLRPLILMLQSSGDFAVAGVFDAWLEILFKYAENRENMDKITSMSALTFLCDVWMMNSKRFDQDLTAKLMMLLKKKLHDKKGISYTAVVTLFRLLERFALDKENAAPVLYKSLAFFLVENINSFDLRSIIFLNFRALFESNSTIPIGILMDPLLKFLQKPPKDFVYNNSEFEFMLSIARHPKLTVLHAVQIFLIMADVYLNNLPYSNISRVIVMIVLERFSNEDAVKEAIIQFSKASLTLFYTSYRKKNGSLSPKGKSKLIKGGNDRPSDTDTLDAQKRALIIEIIRPIIELKIDVLNDTIKNFILFTYHQIKVQQKTEHRGLKSLLSMYGDNERLISTFEQDLKQSQTESEIEHLEKPGNYSPRDDNKTLDNSQDKGIKNMRRVSSQQAFAGTRESPIDKILKDPDFTSPLKELASKMKKTQKNPVPLTKAEMFEIASKKVYRPEPKVLDDIQDKQHEFHIKKLKALQQKDSEQEKIEKQKKIAMKEIELRKIEQGVARGMTKDIESMIIFPEGSSDLQKVMQLKIGLPEIEVISLDAEEERDKNVVGIILKKYHKIIKHLFVSYANSGFSAEGKETFNDYAKKTSVINVPEILKMISDHDCNRLVTKEEVKTILRLVKTNIMEATDVYHLEFNGFEQFLIQLAIFMFSRPPKNLQNSPMFISIEEMFKIFRDATFRRGKNTVLYDDPDKAEMGDPELNSHLNAKLKDNPDYPIPESYKKIKELDYQVHFDFPQALASQINPKYTIAYEMVNEIVLKALNVQLLEPNVDLIHRTKARLKVFNPLSLSLPNDNHLKPLKRDPNDKNFKTEALVSPDQGKEKKKVLKVESKVNISYILKEQVAQFPYKDRARAQEVAEVVEEMMQAVTDGKTKLPQRNQNQIVNQALQERIQKEEESKKQKEDRDLKYKKNMEMLKKENEELKKKAEQKKLEKQQKEVEENEKLRQKQQLKEENKKKDLEKRKEELLAHKEKQKQEEERKKKDEEEQKTLEKQKKQQEHEEFNNKYREKIKEKSQNFKVERENEEKKKQDLVKKTQQSKTYNEKKAKEILERDREKTLKDRENMERIKQCLITENKIKQTLDRHSKQLKIVYEYFVKSTHIPIGTSFPQGELIFDQFKEFASLFTIYPGIISINETREIFNQLTVGKIGNEKVLHSLNYEEFLQFILRVTAIGKDKFDKIYEYNKAKLNEHEEIQEQINNSKENVEAEGDAVDEIQAIDGATASTLEGFFLYMDLPNDKQNLIKSLNSLKTDRKMFWREKKNYWKKLLPGDTLQGNENGEEDEYREDGNN